VRGRSELPQREQGDLRGVDDLEGFAFRSIDELVVDEQAGSREVSTKQAAVDMEWGFTVVGMICRSEV